MPDTTASSKRSPGGRAAMAESLDHLATIPTSAMSSGRGSDGIDATALRQELDVVRTQLLMAVDAVAGAEAERSVAQSRVRELEHQHHMLEVERDELRRQIGELNRGRWAGRIARGMARRLRAGLSDR